MGILKAYCPEISSFNTILLLPVYLYQLSQQRKARITVTPYKSKVRYRYPGEDWQVIDGDDYEINNTPRGTEELIPRYRIIFTARVIGRFPSNTNRPVIFNDGDIISLKSTNSFGGIIQNSIVFNSVSKRLEFKSISNSASSNSPRYNNTSCYIRDSVSSITSNEPGYKTSVFLYDRSSTSTYLGISLASIALTVYQLFFS